MKEKRNMDEVRINEEILSKLAENYHEFKSIQDNVKALTTHEVICDMNRRVNDHVLKFAREHNKDVYWVCANFIPKVTVAEGYALMGKGGSFTISTDIVVELIPVEKIRRKTYGKRKNTKGRTAGR